MISLDTETTGLDLYHGALPFLVTTCNDEGEQLFWEWPVNPLTRKPVVSEEDIAEVSYLITKACSLDGMVLQNPKFDYTALKALDERLVEGWDWSKIYDTLVAGHLLASNKPHNLTDMGIQYLGVNIEPYEKKVHQACNEARRRARSKYKDWKIAKKDLEGMPSAGEDNWKADMWLPRLIAQTEEYEPDHPWWTVTSDYANADSGITLPLFRKQWAEIQRRGLEAIYLETLKVLPIAQRIEARGVTVSGPRRAELQTEYEEEIERLDSSLRGIAKTFPMPCPECADPARYKGGQRAIFRCEYCGDSGAVGYELSLPNGAGNNKSLRTFCFDFLKLPPLERSDKTGEPSLNKNVLEEYQVTLPERSKAANFVKALVGRRKRATALSYMNGYERYWLPFFDDEDKKLSACFDNGEGLFSDWYVLHPSLNPTGTNTLRWSSENPNEQNISKKEGFNLRYCFGPAPGREWYSLDAKGIEDRLPAYKSGQQELIDIFEKSDEPPYYGSNHLLRFHTVYQDIWEGELGKVCREKECCDGKIVDESLIGPHCKKKYAASNYQWCKNGGFAVQYGAVEMADGWGTADKAFHKRYSHRLLKERFSKLEELNQWCIKQAKVKGYVETMPDKTVDPNRGYPLLCTRTDWGQVLETVPLNYYIQGTACWWMRKAMVRCQAQLDEWRARDGFDGYIVMQVHDELVFDFPKSRIHPKEDKGTRFRRSNLWRVRILQGLMAKGGDDIGIPTPVGVEYHDHDWSKGVTL